MNELDEIIYSKICPNNYVLEIKHHQDEQFRYSINIKNFEASSTRLSWEEYVKIMNILYSNDWFQKLRDYIKGKNPRLSAFGLSGTYIYIYINVYMKIGILMIFIIMRCIMTLL